MALAEEDDVVRLELTDDVLLGGLMMSGQVVGQRFGRRSRVGRDQLLAQGG
jgi:hypothetical protein